MNSTTYQILTLITSLIGVVLTRFAVPWLKSKTSTQQLDMIKMWISVAVAAAEQMRDAGLIDTEKRKEYAIKFIRDKGITITDKELDALIEAAVFEINKAKYLLYKDLQYYEATLEETVDQE